MKILRILTQNPRHVRLYIKVDVLRTATVSKAPTAEVRPQTLTSYEASMLPHWYYGIHQTFPSKACSRCEARTTPHVIVTHVLQRLHTLWLIPPLLSPCVSHIQTVWEQLRRVWWRSKQPALALMSKSINDSWRQLQHACSIVEQIKSARVVVTVVKVPSTDLNLTLSFLLIVKFKRYLARSGTLSFQSKSFLYVLSYQSRQRLLDYMEPLCDDDAVGRYRHIVTCPDRKQGLPEKLIKCMRS